MPNTITRRRAPTSKRRKKAPSTQAGEYVRKEMHATHKVRKGVKSRKQAVAIGRSKARRDGIIAPRKKSGTTRSRSTTRRPSTHS